jgi:LAO/AO transport system kinase
LSAVENDQPESRAILKELFPFTGHAYLVGVTGATGTGKSTLVNQLAKSFRSKSNTEAIHNIAIIAVDPSSPFSGGALLGDRIRMQDLAGDKGIFIRSMASRGALGGLAHKTAAFATILDGAGYDIIIIETVGAGQAEVDITRLAHTVLVIEAPGLGDGIQAIKAGILEIADILVVNKADRPEAENTARALKMMLEMTYGNGVLAVAGKHRLRTNPKGNQQEPIQKPEWQPPVQLTIATEGKGIQDLVTQIQEHKAYLTETDLWHEKETYRLRQDLGALIKDTLVRRWQEDLDQEKFELILDEVLKRKLTPQEAVDLLVNHS